jgi:hypothetical protein
LLESAYWEETMIRKTSAGYKVLSEKTGKSLGGPDKTRAEAEKPRAKWSAGSANRLSSVEAMH